MQEIDIYQTNKLQFPQKIEMIMDTNVFIVNTVASVDSTGYIKGLINKMKPAKGY